MPNIKLDKNKGIVFWITGLSGSGKTNLGKKIKKSIITNYGPTILFSGDDVRRIISYKKYSPSDRLKVCTLYSKLCQFISDQGINIETITTSEIRITCIIDEARLKDAVQSLHSAFELEK